MAEKKIEESHKISDKPSSSPDRPSSGSTGTYSSQPAPVKSTASPAQTSGADSINPGSKAGTATALNDSSRISREASSSGSPSGKARVSSDSFKDDMWKTMTDFLKPQEGGASTKKGESSAPVQDGASNADRSRNNTGSGNANISDKAEADKAREQNAQMAQAANQMPQMMQPGNNGGPPNPQSVSDNQNSINNANAVSERSSASGVNTTRALNGAGVQPLNENKTAADRDAAAAHKGGASPNDGSKPNAGTSPNDGTKSNDGTKPNAGTSPNDGTKSNDGTKTDGEKKPDGKDDKYTVKKGDSLWKIAKENNIPFKDVLDANKDLKNPDLIYPDQKVNLPKSDTNTIDKNQQMQQMMQKMTELMNRTNDMMKNMNEMSRKNGTKSNDGTSPKDGMKPDSGVEPSNNRQNNNQQMMNQMMMGTMQTMTQMMQTSTQMMQMMQMMQNSMLQNNKINPVNNNNTNNNNNSNDSNNNTKNVNNGNTEIPNYGPNPTKQQIGTMLDAAAKKYGIPANLLKAVAWQESKWNPKESSFDGGHGKGLMQIDDRFHNFAKTKDVWDPVKNLDYGANYLSKLYKQTGSWDRALKKYNGGSAYPPLIRKHMSEIPWSKFG